MDEKNRSSMFWLSFSGADGGFLGVIITLASSFPEAVMKMHLMGINPGGSVLGLNAPQSRYGGVSIAEAECQAARNAGLN